jgi:iron complex outermembrane recepter protein
MTKHVSGLAFAAAAVAALQCSTAIAQVAPQAGEGEEASTQGDIIVTAQRRSESLERTPVAVAVIGAESLAKQAIVSEADLQLATPGLTVKAGQSSNQLNYSIRGQTVDAFTSSRPSVLPYFNEVQVGSVGASSFYDLESVQVLKGPQGTLFGRNSTGGAVLFTSVKPRNEFGGYAALRAGNYSHFQAEGAINVPIVDDKVLLRIAGFLQRRNGFQYNLFYGERVGDVKRENIRGSLTIKPSDTIENNLVVAYGHTGGGSTTGVLRNVNPDPAASFVPAALLYSPGLDAALGGVPGAWNAYLALHPKADPLGLAGAAAKQNARGPYVVDQDGANFIRAKSLTMSNITTIDLGENTQIKNVLGYVWQRSLESGEFDGSNLTIDSNGVVGQNNNDIGRGGTIKQFSEELQLNGKAFDNKLTYVIGGYFSDESDHSRSLSKIVCLEPFIPCTDQYNSGRRTNKTYAGYGQGSLDLSDIVGLQGLSFTAGARYSSEKVTFEHTRDDFFITNPRPQYLTGAQSQTFNKFSWQLGLEEQVNDNLLIYLKSRRSFRSGGFNFYAPPLAGLGNNAGAEYLPETATDIEFGAKFRGDVGGMPTRLNLAVYDMKIDDIQRANYVSINGSLAGLTVNVPKSKVTGFELDGLINPADWLSMGGSVNYTNARFTDGRVQVFANPLVNFGPYPDTPKWNGSVFAEMTGDVNDHMQLSLRGDVYHQTKSFFGSTNNTINPFTDISGYTIANFRLGLEDKNAGWSVSGVVKNAFRKTYYVGGLAFYSLFSLNTVVPGEPRTFLMEARYKF